MAKIKTVKWYATNEFTYRTFHFFRDQEIKGLTDAEIAGLNEQVYKKEVETDMEIVEESKKEKEKK